MPAYIQAIGTAVPPHTVSQAAAADYMAQVMHITGGAARLLRQVYTRSGISTRHSVLDDFGGEGHFFVNGSLRHPSTAERMAQYRTHALPLAEAAVHDCLTQADVPAAHITHLIVVSCTGLYAPGLDIELMERMGMPADVQRTAIQFMGCYAAVNALKVADYIVRAEPSARVLVVCVELCTLHFQHTHTKDNLLANALFADGAAAALVSGQRMAHLPALQPVGFKAQYTANSKQEMVWQVGNHGFDIQLTAYVPQLIEQGIAALVQQLCEAADLTAVDGYAIHPGGKNILAACEAALGTTPDQHAHSYGVLEQYGNMSSPTILFVLQRWLQATQAGAAPQNILACAFGPGLTMEAAILQLS